uniref:DEK-C domain-containing protein n=1 Tax=Ananas comosus var. bracteatus TaxID=296719 RepID=A0A6V7NX56_ANACO|nr:unnamed protein product [Ananas comosus var. bracteatus]
MVSDEEIASCVASVLRQSPSSSPDLLLRQVEATLGLDLSHKADFIRHQIDLLLPHLPPLLLLLLLPLLGRQTAMTTMTTTRTTTSCSSRCVRLPPPSLPPPPTRRPHQSQPTTIPRPFPLPPSLPLLHTTSSSRSAPFLRRRWCRCRYWPRSFLQGKVQTLFHSLAGDKFFLF